MTRHWLLHGTLVIGSLLIISSVSSQDVKETSPVRLPTSIKPLHYLLKLQPFLNSNYSIDGYVEILFEVKNSTKDLILHIEDIITHNDTAKIYTLYDFISQRADMTKKKINIISQTYNPVNNFYTATFDKELISGQKYIFSIKYQGLLNDKFKGFYRSTYKTSLGEVRRVASTQFQDIDARKAFPCFDEPSMKARFTVHLAREINMTSISNMPIIETMPMKNNARWVWDIYDTSVPMSTYLMAFVVADFEHRNSTNTDRLFRVWSRPEAIHQTEYAGDVGPRLLKYFEYYFNMSYPLPKTDMVAVPEFIAGAMENWGLVIYRDVYMLYEQGISAAMNKQWVCAVISHELAHQWFGNIVTMSWWTDLWLNEGFASYVTIIGVDDVEPTWNIIGQFVTREVHGALSADSVTTSHPVRVEVINPKESGANLPAIYYHKGSTLIRMMNHFLTEPTLRKGLTNYLRELQYENSVQDDLWHYLTLAGHADGTLPSHITVKDVMDTWTLQKNYPVLNVNRSPDGTAVITLKRFLLKGDDNSTRIGPNEGWWIPLTWTSESNADFAETKPKKWIAPSMTEFLIPDLPSNDKWIIFNIQQTGFYRINYDTNNWKLLSRQLLVNHSAIHPINRAHLIDDAFQLAKAGQLDYSIPLQLIEYLSKERDLVPWTATLNNMGFIKSALEMSPGFGSLQAYFLSLVTPTYEELGFQDSLDDPHILQLLRSKIVDAACNFGHKGCLASSLQLYKKWMTTPEDTRLISPNVRHTVYCSAMAHGGSEEWEFAYQQFLKSNVASEQTTLISSMACSKDIWILARYMNISFNEESGIKKQDSNRPFRSIAGNPAGRYIAWDFLRDEWGYISDYVPKSFRFVLNLIKSGTSRLNSQRELKEVKNFVNKNEVVEMIKDKGASQVIEKVENNVAWMEKSYKSIIDWLQKYNEIKLK